MRKKILRFPKNFLWGASTAAHQVEGNNVHSDWWAWEKTQLGLRSGRAADHYRRYKADFALAKKLGHNAHRLSLEWARIEPREGKYNSRAIAHYRDVLRTLKKQGTTTFVTLHHFTNPAWFAAHGGFAKKDNNRYFERYVSLCVLKFGPLVDFWVTINEPISYVVKAYLTGYWPPQVRNIFTGFRVFANMADAHNRAYKVIHHHIPTAQVGVAHIGISYYSKTTHIVDRVFAKLLHYWVNDLFLHWTRHNTDYLGVNYYFHNPVSLRTLGQVKTSKDMLDILHGEGAPYGWVLSPAGIYPLLTGLWKKWQKPIYITEHGIAGDDQKRQAQIQEILLLVHRLIQEGVPVGGYLHWSLLDNFEWQLGFAAAFGLVAVDFKTQKRSIKPSGRLLAEIARKNRIET